MNRSYLSAASVSGPSSPAQKTRLGVSRLLSFADAWGSRRFVPLVLMLALAGCSLDPFKRDPLTSPALRQRLQNVNAVTLESYAQTPQPTTQPVPATLEITIADCRAWVLANNLDLRVALVDPSIANATVSQEEARFESVLFGNANYQDTQQPTASNLEGGNTTGLGGNLGVRIPTRAGGTVTVDFAGNRFETDNTFATLNPSFTSDLGVSISQNLLRDAGFRVNAAPIQIARLQASASYARTRLEVIRAVAEVDRLYWNLYAARQELIVRQEQHDLAVLQLERARRQVEQGDVAEIEVMRAESLVADGLEAIIRAANTVRQRERNLKRLLNVPTLPMQGPTQLITQTPANPVNYDLNVDQLLADAMTDRMELLEVELNLAQDSLSILLARNATLPLAAFDYRYERNGLGANFGDAFEQNYNDDFDTHRVALRFEVPIGSQAARSALRRALLSRIQRLSTRALRQRQIEQEVLDAVDNLNAAWQRVLAARQSVVVAARVLAAEQRRFEQGLNISNEVQDAQIRLADARSNEVRAVTDYQIAQIDIAFATGTVLGSAKIRWEPTELKP